MSDRPITAAEQDILNRLPQASAPIAPPLRFKTCEWKPDSQEAFYDTACGEAFQFFDGTPKENKMRFCPYCGRHLVTVSA